MPIDDALIGEFAGALVELLQRWSGGVLVVGTVVTCPPRGASLFGRSAEWPYFAESVARRSAAGLGLEFVPILARTDTKRWHGPWQSCLGSAYRKSPGRFLGELGG